MIITRRNFLNYSAQIGGAGILTQIHGGAGLGGGCLPPPGPVTASQVFSSAFNGQTWHFQDSLGHNMWIDISFVDSAYGVTDPGNITVWHYRKDSCAGYWNPHTPLQCNSAARLDELWFVLRKFADGRWACIGFNYWDRANVPWKVQILTPAGAEIPYTIIPPNSNYTSIPTSYNAVIQQFMTGDPSSDFSIPPGPVNFSVDWVTDASLTQFQSTFAGPALGMKSLQREGGIAEDWTFLPNLGLVKVYPIVGIGDNNAMLAIDRSLIMYRVS